MPENAGRVSPSTGGRIVSGPLGSSYQAWAVVSPIAASLTVSATASSGAATRPAGRNWIGSSEPSSANMPYERYRRTPAPSVAQSGYARASSMTSGAKTWSTNVRASASRSSVIDMPASLSADGAFRSGTGGWVPGPIGPPQSGTSDIPPTRYVCGCGSRPPISTWIRISRRCQSRASSPCASSRRSCSGDSRYAGWPQYPFAQRPPLPSMVAASRSRTPPKYSGLACGQVLSERARRDVAAGSAVSAALASTQSGSCET